MAFGVWIDVQDEETVRGVLRDVPEVVMQLPLAVK
jgi:hypothetical protein